MPIVMNSYPSKRRTGRQLQTARRKAGLSAAAIADQLGVTRQRVYGLESQRSVTPAAEAKVLAAIAALAGAPQPEDAGWAAAGEAMAAIRELARAPGP